MRITVIHQYYLMPGMPGGSRFNELCQAWARSGHEVTVIAGNLDYLSGTVPDKYKGKWITREYDGKVRVIRCLVPRTYSKSYAGRAWAFLGFTLTASLSASLTPRPDVVVGTSPPLLVPLVAWVAARARARPSPWVFEVRDLWPESAITTGVIGAESTLARVLYAVEAWAYRASDKINVLTPAFRQDILKRDLADEEKICFIPNGADLRLFGPSDRQNPIRAEYGWGDRFVALYAGAHGRANGLGQLIDAAELLRDDEKFLLVTFGDGPERAALRKEAERRGLENIRFYGAIPKSRMSDAINAADAGVAVLQDNPTFRTVYPNKVFDYMACERPVLLAIDGAARELVCKSANSGLFSKPEDAKSLVRNIKRLERTPSLRATLGKNGRAWVEENVDRDKLADEYLEILEALSRSHRSPHRLKRVVDVLAAVAGLTVTIPVLAAAGTAVKLTMGSPVLFRQQRPGLRGKPFEMLKLRTMKTADKGEGVESDAARITPLGRFLRRTSLDEIPALWNVLRGDMSLVGPRPLLMQYLPRYSKDQARRHEVKPGLTGWAQVNGRNSLDWAERLAMDVWYVDNQSLSLDAKIVAKTLLTVVGGEGVSAPEHATMPEFMGDSAAREFR